MPFKSEAQRRYLHATKPDIAKRWEAETPPTADLPEHVKPKPASKPRRKGKRRGRR